MQSNRRRFAVAGMTIFVVLLSIMIVAFGPPAQGAHIPATGPLPANCVEFQVNTLGTKSPTDFPGVNVTVTSWDNGSESHTVNFTVSGLATGQYVDASVKSGQDIQEPGPFGNGAHSFSNGHPNAISHIRFCVFQQTTTTTTEATTTTQPTTTTTTDPTTTTTQSTTTTTGGSTTTTQESTTTTDPGESTTTTDPGETTTTTAPSQTTTTLGDEVLGTTITSPSTTATDPGTIPDEVLGTTIVASDLPFTGVEATLLGQLALGLLALGALILLGLRTIRGRSGDSPS
jgi:hypothetical protein